MSNNNAKNKWGDSFVPTSEHQVCNCMEGQLVCNNQARRDLSEAVSYCPGRYPGNGVIGHCALKPQLKGYCVYDSSGALFQSTVYNNMGNNKANSFLVDNDHQVCTCKEQQMLC